MRRIQGSPAKQRVEKKEKNLKKFKKKKRDISSIPITDAEIDQFNKAVRENYRAALKELKEAKINKTKRKTFKYDLGEDTDSENEFNHNKRARRKSYQFMVTVENKPQESKQDYETSKKNTKI